MGWILQPQSQSPTVTGHATGHHNWSRPWRKRQIPVPTRNPHFSNLTSPQLQNFLMWANRGRASVEKRKIYMRNVNLTSIIGYHSQAFGIFYMSTKYELPQTQYMHAAHLTTPFPLPYSGDSENLHGKFLDSPPLVPVRRLGSHNHVSGAEDSWQRSFTNRTNDERAIYSGWGERVVTIRYQDPGMSIFDTPGPRSRIL